MKCEIKSVGLKLNLKRTLNEKDVSKFPWRRCCSQLPHAVEKRQTKELIVQRNSSLFKQFVSLTADWSEKYIHFPTKS